jgi:23S rRNA (guanine745-N1)-methyltransferase
LHSFDVARSGYVNLLPARKKLAPSVGDSREMLSARRRFLETGHFAPLANEIVDLVADSVGEGTGVERGIAEIGSGTGYYIGRVRDRLHVPNLSYFGFDISKEAVKQAARHDPRVTFVLADVKRQIPLVDGSVAALLDVFAPRNAEEFRRVLDAEGSVVVALPAPDHLQELVKHFDLLTVPDDKIDTVADGFGSTFELTERRPISYEMRLSPEEALDLIAMGPSARHVDLRRVESELQDRLSVTASFAVQVFRPRG